MSIDRTQQSHFITASSAQQDLRVRTQTREVANTSVNHNKDTGTQVTLSSLTQQVKNDASQDINTERLAAIKSKMDAGELPLDSDKIANALVNDIFQLS